MTRAKAVYRALLRFYPAAFRNEYGNQMLRMFAEQLDEARRRGGRCEQAALWLHAASDALTIAPQEHCHVILQDLRYALRTMAELARRRRAPLLRVCRATAKPHFPDSHG